MEEEVYVSMNNYDVLKKSRRFKFRWEGEATGWREEQVKDETYRPLEWQKIKQEQAII
jgi:hypothetical protein